MNKRPYIIINTTPSVNKVVTDPNLQHELNNINKKLDENLETKDRVDISLTEYERLKDIERTYKKWHEFFHKTPLGKVLFKLSDYINFDNAQLCNSNNFDLFEEDFYLRFSVREADIQRAGYKNGMDVVRACSKGENFYD